MPVKENKMALYVLAVNLAIEACKLLYSSKMECFNYSGE